VSPYGQLYRLAYLREGRMVGVTFFAADLTAALLVQEMWEETAKVAVLTMKPLGQSRFVARRGCTVLRNNE
jgi:hypothetical protein